MTLRLVRIAIAALCAAAATAQPPPAILPEGVVNAASLIPPQLPGGAIARGSLMRIQGVRFGPGVSVRVRSGQTAVDAVVTDAGPERIEAILPMSAPIGEVSLTITRDGETSSPFPVNVVESGFGIFTQDRSGVGPVLNAPVAPGGVVAIHGTGLGSDRRPEVRVAGRAAKVRSAGAWRGHPGGDEIRFELPKDAPMGCFVPVEVRSGDVASNTVTLAIASRGRPCAQTASWLTGEGVVLLTRSRMLLGAAPITTDMGLAHFGDGLARMLMLPPAGACTAYQRTLTADEIKDLLRGGRGADAHDVGVITINGPNGSQTMGRHPRGPFSYWNAIGGAEFMSRRPARPLFLEPGRYTVNGAGSKQVAAFRTEAAIPPPVEWTSRAPRDIAWKGAAAQDIMLLAASNTDQTTGSFGLALCVAPGSAGRFAIPSELLAKLPQAPDGILPLRLLVLAHLAAPESVTGRVAGAAASLEFQPLAPR